MSLTTEKILTIFENNNLATQSTQLPFTWAWASFGDVCKVQAGYAFKSQEYQETGVLLVRISNLVKGHVLAGSSSVFLPEEYLDQFSGYCLQKGDVLIAMSGATTGKMATYNLNSPALLNQRVGRFTITAPALLDSGYLIQLVSSISERTLQQAYGAAQPNISPSEIEQFQIPLPPLKEQRRIVAKIEALKARSQRVKQELEAIPALLDQFRQSVLAAAFRGDLTADWREKNPDVEPASVLLEHTQKAKDNFLEKHQELSTVQHDDLPELPDSWTWAVTENLSKFESNAICAGPFGTIFKAKDFRDSGIPIIFLRHVGEGKYLTDKPGFMDIDKWKELFKPYSVWGGELLITKLGEPPGSCAIYPEDIGPAMVTPDVIKMSVNTEVALKHYLMYYFNSATSKKIAFGVAYGVTRLRMNLSIFRKLPIPLAPLLEQQEITRQVQILYRIADQVEQQYKEAKSHLDQLNQSILAKAFRGELVPQDPNDEPASVLLERIRAEREKLDTKKKAKGKTEKKSPKAKPEPAEPEQLSLPGFE